MVFLGKKQLGSTSPWIVPRSVTHMKHLHTCLAEIFSFFFTKRTKNFWRSFENGGSQDPNNNNNVDIVTCWPYNIVIVLDLVFPPFNSWSFIFKGSSKKIEKVVPLSVCVAVSFSLGVNFCVWLHQYYTFVNKTRPVNHCYLFSMLNLCFTFEITLPTKINECLFLLKLSHQNPLHANVTLKL